MERCRPWVCLVDGCTSDVDVANTFLEITVADTLAEWLTTDPSAADNVKLYCEAAELVFASLPEDAELGDHSATVYLEMTSAIRVLQATSLTADTNMQVYVDALLTSASDFWAKKLKWLTEHADAVTKNGGQVNSAIAGLERMDANLSEQRAKLLKRIVDDAPYWEAAMHMGCADECKAMVLNRSILQCKALTSDCETTLAQAEHHVEEGLQDATPADVERHARELTRAVQKANHNARSTALEKFHAGALLQVADAVNPASDLVQKVGAKIVSVLCEKTRQDFANLKKSAEEAAGVAALKKECDNCTTLNAALDLYRLGLYGAPVNEWLDQACTIEGALATVAGKATEHSLPSYSTEATAGITEGIVVIRALCMSAELLTAFGTESLQANKIAMRNSCTNTQPKLRKFGIQPESLPRVVVSRYRGALKMR
ncbi:unnamed protein product [Prorocentrum cordatum]|uniref:Uncharacterized protein n=1 Tax=Prorocentrum cordatum TaxID=2364126 RepID=A0ABN9UT03_9DINO|nr:unnamed protein product [Polarella glacialis]